jgi:hypothetical protein
MATSKKELKEAYKQQKFRMGVFQIRNIVNGKVFISSSSNLDAIWNRHRLQLNFGVHTIELLQEDWKQFGEGQFVFETLSELSPKEGEEIDYNKELKLLEEMYIAELMPFGAKGYNKIPAGK